MELAAVREGLDCVIRELSAVVGLAREEDLRPVCFEALEDRARALRLRRDLSAAKGELSDMEGFCQVQGPTRPVMFKKLEVQEATLYLTAQGDHADFRPALSHVAQGVERILNAAV